MYRELNALHIVTLCIFAVKKILEVRSDLTMNLVVDKMGSQHIFQGIFVGIDK